MSPATRERNPNPDLGSAFDELHTEIAFTLNCHALGLVESFDPVQQSATASVSTKQVLSNGAYADYPVLVDCPCVVLGGGTSFLTFPIAKGDPCLILFNDREMDAWIASAQVRPPATERAHAFSDAIVLVGVRPFSKALPNYSQTQARFFQASTEVSLDDKVLIKNAATDLKTVLNGLIDVLTTLTGQLVAGTGMTSANITANLAALNAYKLTIAGLLK